MAIPAESQKKWKDIIEKSGDETCERLEFCYELINKFIKDNQMSINDSNHRDNWGLLSIHMRMEETIKDLITSRNIIKDKKMEIDIVRYMDTAYMIWALTEEFKRQDIIDNVKKNLIRGKDYNLGSKFRNFEFECITAVRFLEEDNNIKAIGGHGNPDFLVNEEFAIECKRISMFIGLLKNTIKARKQGKNYGKPFFIIFNLDYLYNEVAGLSNLISEQEFLKICAIIVNCAMGNDDKYLLGVVFEYVDEQNISDEGAVCKGYKNSKYIGDLKTDDINNLWEKLSLAMTGTRVMNMINNVDGIIENKLENIEDAYVENFYEKVVLDSLSNKEFVNNYMKEHTIKRNRKNG